MTYNEKKRFLEQYVYSVRRIKRLQQEYEEWETIGTNITQKLSNTGIRSSDNQSKVEKAAIHLANIQNTILDEMQESEYTRTEIENTINSVKDLRRRELLEMKYIRGLSVHKIAMKWDKAEQDIYRQLRTAVKKIDI